VQTTDATKHAEGKKLLEKAREVAPNEWRVVYNLALAYVRIGRDDRALELARELQARAPANEPMVAEARKLESNLLEKQKPA
ncbi:MAG TPA: tetratricopeptide repeat protein, partial [Myxococcaceae bacterium]|nr:tetratricopeptide repeat protein [Myxococcaceae bacterium]